jgi:hypothetical protein
VGDFAAPLTPHPNWGQPRNCVGVEAEQWLMSFDDPEAQDATGTII